MTQTMEAQMITASKTATPTKLRSGAWGAKVSGDVREGDVVTIRTRAGKSWQARIERVVWTGEGVSICATASLDRAPAARTTRRRGTWTGCRCGSVEEYAKDSDCARCQHDR